MAGRRNKPGKARAQAPKPASAPSAANNLSSFIAQQRLKGVQLSGGERRKVSKAIQQPGKKGQGKKITAAEIKQGRKAVGDTPDYLATIGRTYGAQKLGKSARQLLEKRGFSKDAGGYYTKSGPITQNVLDKAIAAGYKEGDIRSTLAKDFLSSELDDRIGSFMGEGGGYSLNSSTGRWEKQDLGISPTTIPGIGSTGVNEGPYAGLNPDDLPGSTPAEIDYSTMIDPYKIEAKSRERLGALQAGLGSYLGRLQASSSEGINRANLEAEKDINRSQQAAELLGQKLAYGTQYDLAKVNRLAGLQQAKIQQATNLYNLIPSAFG